MVSKKLHFSRYILLRNKNDVCVLQKALLKARENDWYWQVPNIIIQNNAYRYYIVRECLNKPECCQLRRLYIVWQAKYPSNENKF